MSSQPLQRLRVIYGVAGALSYTSVLEMGRVWERLLRRAGVPLAYSQGFNPHPRLQFAAALATGYTSDCEVLDIWLAERRESAPLLAALAAEALDGLTIHTVEEVPLDSPSPQATLQSLSYRMHLRSPRRHDEITAAIERLLASDEVIIERVCKGLAKPFDLRPLVLALGYIGRSGEDHVLTCELAFHTSGSVRPEEVLGALDLDASAVHIHRTALRWDAKETK